MKCLGIDVGSTTIKGAVLDLQQSEILSTITRPFPAPLPGLPSGWFEVSPTEIEQGVSQVLAELCATTPDPAGLFFSGQMGGVILVEESGNPLTNYLSWRDQRTLAEHAVGSSYLDSIREMWNGEVLQSLGNELQPGSATSLLFWLGQNQKLPTGAIPVSVADFVIGRLCGGVPHMHVTQAIGMLNLRTTGWHRDAFDLLGLEALRLPEVCRRVEPAGTATFAGHKLQVYGAYGDQQCALHGAGLRGGDLSINVSTGSQVSRLASHFDPGNYQTRLYFDDTWLNTFTHLPAGRSLNVLVDLLKELAAAEGVVLKDPWGSIVERATAVKATELEIDLTFFAGPLGSTGQIREITTENLTVGQLFHAAFRSMADNYVTCAERLKSDVPWKSIVLSGGLTRSVPLLRQMIEDRFTAPVRETVGDETLLGLMELAKSATRSGHAT